MTTHDQSVKQPADKDTKRNSQEDFIYNDLSGLESFDAVQSAVQRPSRETRTPRAVMQLQRTIGNRATQRLLSQVPPDPTPVYQTASPNTIQRTTSTEFVEYLGKLKDKALEQLYLAWFNTMTRDSDNIEEDIASLSNEALLEKLKKENPLNLFRVRKYFEYLNNTDKEAHNYYQPHLNEWISLRQPTLNNVTIPDVLNQLGEFVEYKKAHPEKVQSELKELKSKEFYEQYKAKPVFQNLIKGIELSMSPLEKLDQLLTNFVAIGPTSFNYTMASLSADKFLNGGSDGDCNTLVRAFQQIGENYLGIAVEYHHSGEKGFHRFIAPQKQTIDNKTGNVNNGAFWVFDNHYWIEYGGQTYDVLFGTKGAIDSKSWVEKTGDEDKAEVFGEQKLWATGEVTNIATRYTTTPSFE